VTRLVALAIALTAPAAAEPGGAASWPTHGWRQATPQGAGLDPGILDALDHDLAGGRYSLVDSFQVFRCGTEVFSRSYSHDYSRIYARQARTRGPLNARLTGPYNYFDPGWHPYYHGTDLHTMQSITSAIIGIAVTRGDFKASLERSVLSYFDVAKVKNVDERKRRMTLRHVLTMTVGLQWNEDVPYDDPRSDSSLMEATDDWVQYVIDKPMTSEPGSTFNYSSGATELLAYIFQKETGQDIDAYGEKYLFEPLGIKHYWKRTYRGIVDTEGGLYLNGSDLAKIGYLYLHDGIWNGQRLISREWIRQSLAPQATTDWQGLKYGFLWWLQPRSDRNDYIWHGIGLGGQRLMVFPAEEMIVTFTGWDILKDIAFDVELAERVLPAARATSCDATAR
jgi:hypothetical protein